MLIQKVLEILYYFGEAFIVGLASVTYMGITPAKKRIFLFTILFGLFVTIIRMLLLPALHIPNGIHVIVFFIFNVFFLMFIFELSFLGSIICDLLYFITIMVFEYITLIILKLIGIGPTLIGTSLIYLNIFRWINFIIIGLLVFVMLKTKFVLIPMKKALKLEKDENQ